MADNGYIKLYRSLRDSSEWTLPDNQLRIMIAILLNANYKPSKVFLEGNTRVIEPGQLLTSRENLKKICGKHISERTIRSAVSNLIKSGFLTKEVTKGNHTILSVNNWEKYQSEGEATKEKTKHRPSTGQAPTKSKEGKEGKEGKELKDLGVLKNNTPFAYDSAKTVSTNVKEYYRSKFEEINGMPPVQFSKSDSISINANVLRLMKNDPQMFTFDFFCALIDHCFTWGCSGLAAMFSENAINGFIQSLNKPSAWDKQKAQAQEGIAQWLDKKDSENDTR